MDDTNYSTLGIMIQLTLNQQFDPILEEIISDKQPKWTSLP